MADYATKQDVQKIVDKAVEDLSEVITTFAHQVDQRFNKIEKDIIDLKASHDRLLNTMDKFVARLDTMEIESAAKDERFERLLDWARMVSKKTGIPLRNL